MSLYTISDLHLSLSADKPMDVFYGWDNYMSRLEANWKRVVTDCDTVIIPGDISWALKLEDTLEDLKFIDALPGKKILIKGNHDLWWSTMTKINAFLIRALRPRELVLREAEVGFSTNPRPRKR